LSSKKLQKRRFSCVYQKKVQKNLHFFTEVFQSLLLGWIYYVGLTILRRIADYFVQNRRFFLQESQIFCTFAANFEKYTI